jgi:hypothetical protein
MRYLRTDVGEDEENPSAGIDCRRAGGTAQLSKGAGKTGGGMESGFHWKGTAAQTAGAMLASLQKTRTSHYSREYLIYPSSLHQ